MSNQTIKPPGTPRVRRALALAIVLQNDSRTPDELKRVVADLVHTLELELGIQQDAEIP
jgi:hypothetical protein